jgi:hypothetical protein
MYKNKSNRTIYIVRVLNDRKYFQTLNDSEKELITNTKNKVNNVLLSTIGLTVAFSFAYNKISKFLIRKNFAKKILDFGFIISMTYISTYIHSKALDKIYEKNLTQIGSRYKFLLKNSLTNTFPHETYLDYLHSLNNKYLYFMLLLTLRIVF